MIGPTMADACLLLKPLGYATLASAVQCTPLLQCIRQLNFLPSGDYNECQLACQQSQSPSWLDLSDGSAVPWHCSTFII